MTLSRKGAKSRTHGRKLRSTGTKARTRVGRVHEPRTELEKKLEAHARELEKKLDARTRERDENRDRAGPLDVATMRDIGARREYQDYAPSARVSASAARRLHCIADSARCGLPR